MNPMEQPAHRPYLIIPKLVEQPTWGGTYIAGFKGVEDQELKSRKIGQSYELYGKSLLSFATDTADTQFLDDFTEYNKTGSLPASEDCIELNRLAASGPKAILGPAVSQPRMPLLIKFTQALGNSFQLHIKKSAKSDRWLPKPESWYYLEDGIVTFGVKKGADLDLYKNTCAAIEAKTEELSSLVKEKKVSPKDAATQIGAFIKTQNPWQFVNVHRVRKHAIVDLSSGGIHHSWEEDSSLPQGNIVYEVQLDVSDEDSTIRSFDKGKMQPDGTVRKINIEDYFRYLDTRPENNDLNLALQRRSGQALVQTPHYSMDAVPVSKELILENTTSFAHLFVTEGKVGVETPTHTIEVGKGFSCFIPHAVKTYSLTPLQENAAVLKTYVK